MAIGHEGEGYAQRQHCRTQESAEQVFEDEVGRRPQYLAHFAAQTTRCCDCLSEVRIHSCERMAPQVGRETRNPQPSG